jgi:hypothetical protein
MTDKQPQPQGDAAMPGLQRLVMGIFRGELAMFHADDGDYCRWADAQAAIAARDAEIERLRKDLTDFIALAARHPDGYASAPEAAQPAGYVLVPLRPNKEMARVLREEDWSWADLLAAAEAITEDQYDSAAQPADTEAQVQEAMRMVRRAVRDGDGSIDEADAAMLAIESAIRRLVGGK